MKKNILLIILFSILITSCNKNKLPTPEETYNFYVSCAKGNVNETTHFLTEYPEYANIPLYETTSDLKRYIKTKTVYNNASYQKFFNYLCDEGIIQFTNEEIDNGEKKKLQNTYKRYPINVAARYGNLEIVKVLLSYNADVNIYEEGGNTPLISAAQNNHLDVIKEILNHQAKINYKNDSDTNALGMAIINNNFDIVFELLKHEADIEMPTQGYTPLMLAGAFDNKEIMELLIKNGANINAKTKDGQTALELAVLDNKKVAIDVLLKHGVNINELISNGNTVLMSAAATDNFELVKYLINAGADIKINNSLGYNALDFAVAAYEQNKNSFQIIDYLERKGLKCSVVDLSQYRKQNSKNTTQSIVEKTQKTTEKDFKYKLTDDGEGVVITKYTGTNKWIEIPKEIEGFPVRQIGQIFNDSKTIYEQLLIPDSVTIIKDQAFYFSKIKKLYIPESVKTIGVAALENIDYVEELTLPSQLDDTEFYITFGAHCNLNEVIIPNSTKPSYKVGVYTNNFGETSSTIKKIIIPNGIKYVQIGGKLKNIGQIKLPDSLEYFTGRVLLYPSNNFIMPNKQLKFSYSSYLSSYPQNFAPYITEYCTLKERKEIQDFWRNLGYDGYFSDENIF